MSDKATDRSERAKDIRLVGEWLRLLEPFSESMLPHMDARGLILAIARADREKRPTTVVRYVRYLDKAIRRQADELAKLRTAAA